ncbi:hypothetical protein BGZ96_002398 [Linnemannia gamsii]|uniref:Phosphatidylinositol 3,4,5-trisphosphate 3-phosphatase and dual-specificity protein phosphatase PTEN n=1 Tax=Linnemannia gamsii TaxID=64522 RepID=A0ABQ7JKT9_9FUNG|nr:hypothetical protein BGZ96_002398 [Linnemannia gamsii]
MGYPSKSLEAFYRNPMSDVEKFLDSRHEGTYKVYNLCSERSYSDQRFHGRVAQFPFPDHSPPPFQLIHPFCEDVSDWLHTISGNVVAIHCKAGKGRTGVMICSFLVHCGATADEAIQLYGQKRTLDGCGVTIPSQLRYIRYYEQFLESRTLNYDPRLLVLQELVIDTIPKPLMNVEPSSKYLILTIMSSDVKIYESVPQHCKVDSQKQQLRISISDKIVLAGDVKMMLWYDSPNENALSLTKNEVDKACKDKLHTVFDKDFGIQVQFHPALAQQSPLPTLDSLPNRAILLKYKNHEGPNSVQISPPFFSTLKLSPARNGSSRPAFNFTDPASETATAAPTMTSTLTSISTSTSTSGAGISGNESGQAQNRTPPSSTGSTVSSVAPWSSTPKAAAPVIRSPLLMHSKAPFKPVWDKDRDRDDNWDTASISSDCSESDANLEWWYTKPPRPSLHPSAGTAATTVSASIVQPETTVRVDPETRMLVLADSSQVEHRPSLETHGYHVRPILSSMASSLVSVATGSLISPNAAYKSPPHSASSPLAREIKFEREISSTPPPPHLPVTAASSCYSSPIQYRSKAGSCHSSTSLEEERAALRSRRCPAPGDRRLQQVSNEKGDEESLGGGYLNENGHLIGGGDTDDGGDSGIESVDSAEHEKDRGWVDSVSRWLWSADGKRVSDLGVGGGPRCDRCDE